MEIEGEDVFRLRTASMSFISSRNLMFTKELHNPVPAQKWKWV